LNGFPLVGQNGVLMVDMLETATFNRDLNSGIAELLVVVEGVFPPPAVEFVDMFELHPQNDRLHFIQTGVETDYRMDILLTAAMVPQGADIVCQFVIIGCDESTVTEPTQVFAREERKTPKLTKSTCLAPFKIRPKGLGAILDEVEAVLLAKSQNAIHIRGLTE